MLVFLNVFIAVFLLSAGVLSLRWKFAIQLEQRVKKMITNGRSAPSYGTFAPIMKMLINRISESAMRYSSVSLIKRTEQQIHAMGLRGKSVLKKWVAIKLSWAMVTGIVITITIVLMHNPMAVLFAVFIIILSLLFFRLMLNQRIRHFQQAIRKQLPSLLDMLTISVEAGLGFDQALERNSRHVSTELSREINHIMAEMNLGKSRREALRDAGLRVGVEEFSGFLNAVIQADRLGMGLANVLRVQASETRRKLSEKVKEQAMKAPIKILFPLVLFIFPSLFIIILGPAVIRIISIFIK